MIVWINGPFGVGKTTAAKRLARRLPDSRTYDPERLGWVLQHSIGRLQRGDFQHLRSWRHGTVLSSRFAARRSENVVVPMSVLRPDYLDGMLDRLRAAGHDVRHFTLDATPPVLRDRISGDTQQPRAIEWRRHHIDIYADVKSELFSRGPVVDTTESSPDEVAASIADSLVAPA